MGKKVINLSDMLENGAIKETAIKDGKLLSSEQIKEQELINDKNKVAEKKSEKK